jgi:hypothetical protein
VLVALAWDGHPDPSTPEVLPDGDKTGMGANGEGMMASHVEQFVGQVDDLTVEGDSPMSGPIPVLHLCPRCVELDDVGYPIEINSPAAMSHRYHHTR